MMKPEGGLIWLGMVLRKMWVENSWAFPDLKFSSFKEIVKIEWSLIVQKITLP
jgi:hypothetical protein